MAILTRWEWEAFLRLNPKAHILQSPAWGELKAGFGWQPERVIHEDTGAQILFRRLPLGVSVAYLPKGPIGPDWPSLWLEVDALCRRNRAIFLKIEPDGWDENAPGLSAFPGGVIGSQPIQPRRTITVSLQGSEDDWMARMKQKTRYNIRLAAKKGVTVRTWNDLTGFHNLMTATGTRDGFGVHSEQYYRRAYELFTAGGLCEILVAEFEDRPLAALMVFFSGKRAWYFYGASLDEERQRMPAYLLQWEAMRLAAARGCEEYDLWGVPDADEDALESQFESRSDGLWGVYRFKRGFGGTLKRSAPAYDRVYSPALYQLYRLYRRGRAEA